MPGGNRYVPDTVRAPSGAEVPVARSQDRILYSSALVASNQSTDLAFFGYALGKTVTGQGSTQAAENHTNMRQDGKLDGDEWMHVQTVGLELPLDVSLSNAQALLESLYFEFILSGNTPVYQGMARHFPAGNGIALVTTASDTTAVNNGAVNAPRVRFAQEIELKAATSFRVPGKIKVALTMASANQLCRMVFRGYGMVSV